MPDYVELLKAAQDFKKAKQENLLFNWEPIEAHKRFLNCNKRKKGLIAANRTGKTKSLLFELVTHATGIYPSWWQGIRFSRPVRIWLIGMSFKSIRDTIQTDLIGQVGMPGTGFIPKHILDKTNIIYNPGMKGVIDTLYIPNANGGNSYIKIWSGQHQSREDFQGAEVDIVAFDEEPGPEVHNECLMRIATSKGYAMYSFTPLNGETEVWKGLATSKNAEFFSISMDEVPWLDEETIEDLLHGLSDMEKRARRYGIPGTGGGQIFGFDPKEYLCKSFEIPSYWPVIGGIDIGFNHPTGAIAIAWDRNSDTLYAYQEFKAKEKSASEVSQRLRNWGVGFATSHDAFNKTFGRGESVADIFSAEGLKLFSAGKDPWMRIEKAKKLISNGRLWIFEDRCPELVKEMRTYHTKITDAGKVIIYKKDEDVVDAFLHAVAFYEKAAPRNRFGVQSALPKINQWTPVDKRYGI